MTKFDCLKSLCALGGRYDEIVHALNDDTEKLISATHRRLVSRNLRTLSELIVNVEEEKITFEEAGKIMGKLWADAGFIEGLLIFKAKIYLF